jgi:hypothetical protein
MNLFRIRIRPLMIEFADMETTFAYCLKHGLLGVGWGTPSRNNTKDWDTYFSEASPHYGNLKVCVYRRQPGPVNPKNSRETPCGILFTTIRTIASYN